MKSSDIVLRDYQKDVVRRISEAWRTHRSIMVQMPTGTGKTHVLVAVVRAEKRKKNNPSDISCNAVWIIAHRRELVAQIEETTAKYGISAESMDVRVMSIQWLTRHWDDMQSRPRLIIIDEAHHALADTYMELWKRYPEARKLGMTATPCRMNRRGFADLFETLVTSWSIAEFIVKGRLSLFDYVSICSDSEEQRLINGLEKRGTDGDYQVKEMNEVLNRRQSIERLYMSFEKFAGGKKGIVYAISIAHARQIAYFYSLRGVNAVAIDSKTPVMERKRLVEEFKNGDIKVLVNVDVFSEGFDCPDVEFVQMARPTLSLAKYLQQVGRGLRKVKGKDSCTLIDNVGLYRMFGLPTVAWDWAAMFRGDTAGRGQHFSRIKQVEGFSGLHETVVERDFGVEMVISHDRLQAELKEHRKKLDARPKGEYGLVAWHDSGNGLWGLKHGDEKITDAIFTDVFDTGYGMAAVGMLNKRCGLVDLSGRVVWDKKNCRSMKFIKDDFLLVSLQNGNEVYVDLHSLRTYDIRPEIKRYGNIELLKVGYLYYSRTKRVYVTGLNIDSFNIPRRDFYLTVFDINVPSGKRAGDVAKYDYKSGYACLLAGDYESFYWLCNTLEDDSIIVRDDDGRYYHVENGKEKRFIGNGSSLECYDEIRRLSEKAKDCVRTLKAAKDMQRLKTLNNSDDAVPFKSGMKWGLKVGGRIIVPPVYRNMMPPVGKYCAVEKYYSQWGIIALDGKVVIEPKYTEVTIRDNGTAILTFVTGKKKHIRLQ